MYNVRRFTLYILYAQGRENICSAIVGGANNILFCPLLSAFVCGKNIFFLLTARFARHRSDKNWTVFFISADDLSSDILYAYLRGEYLPRYCQRGKQAYSFVRLCPPLSAVKEIISFLTARFARQIQDKIWIEDQRTCPMAKRTLYSALLAV